MPGRIAFALFSLSLCFAAAAQPKLTPLSEVGQRDPARQYDAVHADERVTIRGIVNGPAFHFPDYSLIAIEDGHAGAVLQVQGDDNRLDSFRAGDDITVSGRVATLAGMVVVLPEKIAVNGSVRPPVPIEVPLSDLDDFRYLGRLVRTEGVVKAALAAASKVGAYVALEGSSNYKVFIPYRLPHAVGPGGFKAGDRIKATGVAYQFCQQPPYNRSFQMLAHDTSQIIHMEGNWHLTATEVAVALGVILFMGLFLWNRERRLRHQRETLRKTYELGEEILGASSTPDILKKIREVLPRILGVTRVNLYVYNRASKTLEAVAEEGGTGVSISLSAPPGGTHSGAVACFHYRTLLVIPDIDRSPFPMTGADDERSPRSLLFVPMMAQAEVAGILEVDQDDRVRDFSAGEQELAQHLGNQIGVAIRLLDQRSVREQLFRTEKLAAVGRLISGVVNELQTPLSSISDLSHRALDKTYGSPAERDVLAIAAEAQKASAMVARLVSFAAAEQVEARPVPIGALLRSLIDFREGDWKASGIRVRDLTVRDPLYILGSQGQLEQVFLNLLVHAEQALADAAQKVITIRTSVMAKRLLVEIAFTAPPQSRKPEETAAILGVTRSVVAGHGGEVRLIEKNNGDPRFEVELPLSAKPAFVPAGANGEADRPLKRRTALVIEVDDAAQRQMVGLLSARGFRVVPVDNADTGLELSQRMRFDTAFCSVHAPGLNWVELSERMHSRVGAFVLLTLGYDAELALDFEGDGRHVLAKPVQEADLDRVLTAMEPALPEIRHGVA